jgi:hypothetical protein
MNDSTNPWHIGNDFMTSGATSIPISWPGKAVGLQDGGTWSQKPPFSSKKVCRVYDSRKGGLKYEKSREDIHKYSIHLTGHYLTRSKPFRG